MLAYDKGSGASTKCEMKMLRWMQASNEWVISVTITYGSVFISLIFN